MSGHTEAVLRALAFTHITGSHPSHIHSQTWIKLHAMTERGDRWHVVKPEFTALAEGHEMTQAARWLETQGFTVNRHDCRGKPSHYASFSRISEDGSLTHAAATRSGRASINYGETTKTFTRATCQEPD